MQNKIKKFKQLSQEFADRKGFNIEIEDSESYCFVFFALKDNDISKAKNHIFSGYYHRAMDFIAFYDGVEKEYFSSDLDLDKFKSLIKEL